MGWTPQHTTDVIPIWVSVSMISNLAFDQWYPRGLAVKLKPWYCPRPSVTHTCWCEKYAVTARCGGFSDFDKCHCPTSRLILTPDKSASSCASRATNSRSFALPVTYIMKFGIRVSEVDLSILGLFRRQLDSALTGVFSTAFG